MKNKILITNQSNKHRSLCYYRENARTLNQTDYLILCSLKISNFGYFKFLVLCTTEKEIQWLHVSYATQRYASDSEVNDDTILNFGIVQSVEIGFLSLSEINFLSKLFFQYHRWKMSYIKPILKSGWWLNIKNYRIYSVRHVLWLFNLVELFQQPSLCTLMIHDRPPACTPASLTGSKYIGVDLPPLILCSDSWFILHGNRRH